MTALLPALLLPCMLACQDLFVPAAQPRLSLSADQADLGEAAIDGAAEARITLANSGDPATLLATALPGLTVRAATDPAGPAGIVEAPAGETELLLIWRPTGYAPLDAELILLGPDSRLSLRLTATVSPDSDGDGAAALLAGGDDCDDRDAALHPGAAEICGDGQDQDCDGQDQADCDGDGLLPPLDCAPDDPATPSPDRSDPADSADNDCDGRTDEDALSHGSILITEFQPDPPARIELCSRHPADVRLQGLTLRADPADPRALPDLTLPVSGCLALCEDDTPGCARLDLPDLRSGHRLALIADAPLDQLDPAALPAPGADGLSLDPAALAAGQNDRAADWCAAPATPGAANPPCG